MSREQVGEWKGWMILTLMACQYTAMDEVRAVFTKQCAEFLERHKTSIVSCLNDILGCCGILLVDHNQFKGMIMPFCNLFSVDNYISSCQPAVGWVLSLPHCLHTLYPFLDERRL